MLRVLCAVGRAGKGPGRTFYTADVKKKAPGAAVRGILPYFVRKGWIKRAGLRTRVLLVDTGGPEIGRWGEHKFLTTRRGAKAARLACELLPRRRRR